MMVMMIPRKMKYAFHLSLEKELITIFYVLSNQTDISQLSKRSTKLYSEEEWPVRLPDLVLMLSILNIDTFSNKIFVQCVYKSLKLKII